MRSRDLTLKKNAVQITHLFRKVFLNNIFLSDGYSGQPRQGLLVSLQKQGGAVHIQVGHDNPSTDPGRRLRCGFSGGPGQQAGERQHPLGVAPGGNLADASRDDATEEVRTNDYVTK